MALPPGILTAGVPALTAFYGASFAYFFRLSRNADLDFHHGTLLAQKEREVNDMQEFIETEAGNQGGQGEQETSNRAYNRTREQRREKIKKMLESSWRIAYECYKIEDRLQRVMAREETGRIVSIVGIILVLCSAILSVMGVKDLFPYEEWVVLIMWFSPCLAVAILAIGNIRTLKSIRLAKGEIEKTWQF